MLKKLGSLFRILAFVLVTCAGAAAVAHGGNPVKAPEEKSGVPSPGKPHSPPDVEPEKPRYPIHIPPASEIRSLLRNQNPQKAVVIKPGSGQAAVPERGPAVSGKTAHRGGQNCDRAIPTRREFLNMLKSNPADARHILQRCQINVRTISPVRQLPVGNRQLPEDTRQRAVGTWGR